MKSFGQRAWVLPQPVLIIGTYNSDGTPNAMNAAWGGMADYDKVMVCMRFGTCILLFFTFLRKKNDGKFKGFAGWLYDVVYTYELDLVNCYQVTFQKQVHNK